jgi:hypothetical protein
MSRWDGKSTGKMHASQNYRAALDAYFALREAVAAFAGDKLTDDLLRAWVAMHEAQARDRSSLGG